MSTHAQGGRASATHSKVVLDILHDLLGQTGLLQTDKTARTKSDGEEAEQRSHAPGVEKEGENSSGSVGSPRPG